MATLPDARPVTVEEYRAMEQRGVIASESRVELLEGVIVEKPRVNPPHRIATSKCFRALDRIIPPGWYADEQKPITLTGSEPEPVAAIIRGDTSDYFDRHPGPHDVALVVEVADSSLARKGRAGALIAPKYAARALRFAGDDLVDRDRILKQRIYANAAIPFYWVLDLNRRILEVFSDPRRGEYGQRAAYRAEQSATLVLDGQPAGEVLVSDLLP